MMSRLKTKIPIALAVFSLLLLNVSFAQVESAQYAVENQKDNLWYVGGKVGMFLPGNSIDARKALSLSILAGWNIEDTFALEISAMTAPNVSSAKRSHIRNQTFWGVALGGMWHPFNYERLEPFFIFGIEGVSGARNCKQFGGNDRTWGVGPYGGFGFMYHLTHSIAIRTQAKGSMLIDDPVVFIWGWDIGVVYSFGGSAAAEDFGNAGMVGLHNVKVDSDKDGLTDQEELAFGTDPHRPDTDSDGLSDYQELKIFKTNPCVEDSDYDGLSDGLEVNQYKTNPLKYDTDGGGVSDGHEVLVDGTNPLKSADDCKYFEIALGQNGEFINEQKAKEVIKKSVSQLLKNRNFKLLIEGHIDRKLGKSKKQAYEQSEVSANEVKKIIESAGISNERIEVKAYGFSRIRSKINLATGNPKNSRVEMYMHK